jgi:hypothetical protein
MTKLNTKMKVFVKTIFVATLVIFTLFQSEAQTTGKKKFVRPGSEEEKKALEKEKAPSRLGYGINLGNIYFTNYSFSIGLDPNIAYKLDEALAVGFMLKMNYYYEKLPQYGLKYTGWDWGPTLFTRWKPLLKMEDATPFMQGIFLQAEYEKAFVSRPTDEFGNIDVDGDKINPFKTTEDYLYIGLGMASGYPFSSFISFHYNVIDDVNLSRVPFTYRIGFTWNY